MVLELQLKNQNNTKYKANVYCKIQQKGILKIQHSALKCAH